MKKLISIFLIMMAAYAFADTYKITKKGNGEAYIKIEDELVPLKDGDEVEDTDTIVLEEGVSISFIANDTKVIIRKAGIFQMKKVIKK